MKTERPPRPGHRPAAVAGAAADAGLPAPERLLDGGSEEITISAGREDTTLELGDRLRPFLRRLLRSDGLVSLTALSPLCSLAILDTEPGALADFMARLEILAPRNEYYTINMRTAADRSGAARVRSGLLPRSLTLPYRDRKPILPDDAAIFLIRHDPARTPEMRVLLSSF